MKKHVLRSLTTFGVIRAQNLLQKPIAWHHKYLFILFYFTSPARLLGLIDIIRSLQHMENRQDGFPNLPWRICWCPLWLSRDWTCSCSKLLDTDTPFENHIWKLSFSFSDFMVGLNAAACHFLCKDHHIVNLTSVRGSRKTPRNKHLLQHQTIPCSLPNSNYATNTHGHILPLFHQCHFQRKKELVISILYKYEFIKCSIQILPQIKRLNV